jgi:hypothetical protein
MSRQAERACNAEGTPQRNRRIGSAEIGTPVRADDGVDVDDDRLRRGAAERTRRVRRSVHDTTLPSATSGLSLSIMYLPVSWRSQSLVVAASTNHEPSTSWSSSRSAHQPAASHMAAVARQQIVLDNCCRIGRRCLVRTGGEYSCHGPGLVATRKAYG